MSGGRICVLLAAAAGVATAGCRTEVRPGPPRPARTVTVESPGREPAGPPAARQQQQQQQQQQVDPGPEPQAGAPGGVEPDELLGRDPCAARLHEIAGTMLLYYAVNKRLPAELEELRELADPDQEMDFRCPVSGRPYVYVPSGLQYPGKAERLVLHDAEPSHGGARWGVLAAPPKGKRPAAMWAVRLTEDVFRAYTLPGQPGKP